MAHFTGIKALDFRRLHGFPDGVYLPSVRPSGNDVVIGVGETYARARFGPETTTLVLNISPEDASPGDLAVDNDCLIPSPTLTLERAETLASLSDLRRRVRELEAEVKRLEKGTTTEEGEDDS